MSAPAGTLAALYCCVHKRNVEDTDDARAAAPLQGGSWHRGWLQQMCWGCRIRLFSAMWRGFEFLEEGNEFECF